MWEKIIAVNLSSAFYTTRAALKHMRERKWGRIVNIASVHGLVGCVMSVDVSDCACIHDLMCAGTDRWTSRRIRRPSTALSVSPK
jgi:NAD(P)-dependent dehydrogenase (short-subunit alcohol dehydrogenase family)